MYTTEHTLKEFKDKIPKEVYEKVEAAKAELAEALKKDDLAAMREKSDRLNEVLKDVGASMYKGPGRTRDARARAQRVQGQGRRVPAPRATAKMPGTRIPGC